MITNILKHDIEVAKQTAQLIIDTVRRKPDSTLCLAGGNSPLGVYKELVDASLRNEVSYNDCHFVGLDEWVGLGKGDEGSCFETLNEHLFNPLNIQGNQIHFFNGTAPNLLEECKIADVMIDQLGGIDLMLLGTGVNGHLGFNEPSQSKQSNAHIVNLAPITKKVGQKYFSENMELSQGITLGMKQVMDAKKVILIAIGEHKANIVKEIFYSEISMKCPATYLRQHKYSYCFLDKTAASLLNY